MYEGTIAFKSHVQEMLWRCEITGQLSDGAWENTKPFDHWKFWNRLEPVTCGPGQPAVVTGGGFRTKRSLYNLGTLIQYIGDRMVKIGRMATGGGDENACDAAGYMPDTLAEWKLRKALDEWQYSFIKKNMEFVNQVTASAYYRTIYTEKDLRKDLREIKTVMKTAR